MPLQPKPQPPYYEPSTASPTTQTLNWRAIVTQSGTNAPVANVKNNTLSGTITWFYDSPGVFFGELIGAFPAGRIFITQSGIAGGSAQIDRSNDDGIFLTTCNAAGTPTNSMINSTGLSIDITIYPS